MSAIEIKTAFHKLIDNIQDEESLQDLFDSAKIFLENRFQPLLDDSSPELLTKLSKSLQSSQTGNFLTTEQLKSEIQTWRTK
ncbi:MAG: hypothetical protein U0X91_00170 [Spirosomataceae bacterium]